ncbi:MAG: glycoside hydrolase family 3 N-terminal domain-containing protein [Propionibacteriaceae bacterium]
MISPLVRRSLSFFMLTTISFSAVACSATKESNTPQQPTASASPVEELPKTSPTTNPVASCSGAAAKMSVAQKAAQVMMVGVNPSSTALDPATVALLKQDIGSVIYIPATTASAVSVKKLSDSIHDQSKISPLIAVDQEGGEVVRFSGQGFSQMPDAATQASWGSDVLQQRATIWGKDLLAAGIDVDLAPVADVVPLAKVNTNEPVALLRRGYGNDPATVSDMVGAFQKGMNAGGVGTAIKHYPGLGNTTTNTDFGVAVDNVTTLADADLGSFREQAKNASMVMVSTVRYNKIDGKQAAFSELVMSSVRNDLKFAGPIVSDDLGAAAAVSHLTPAQRAVSFIAAGGDIVVTVDIDVAQLMMSALESTANNDTAFAKRLTDAAERVLTLKAKRGLYTC